MRSPRLRRALAVTVMGVTIGATLAGCQFARAGQRCSGTAAAQDRTYVLVCRNGRWTRAMTKATAAHRLAAALGGSLVSDSATALSTDTVLVTVGRIDPVNESTPGQCTWGAKEQMHAYDGIYPRIVGDAKDWTADAPLEGWTVTTTPIVHSIVVFQPGVNGADEEFGHAAWVTGVDQGPDGPEIQVIEMNGPAGPFNWDTATYPVIPGMAFIPAPPP